MDNGRFLPEDGLSLFLFTGISLAGISLVAGLGSGTLIALIWSAVQGHALQPAAEAQSPR